MRLLSVLCTVVGFAVGIVLVGTNEHVGEFVSAETTVVGYLVVIAAVLTLSSEDMWMLSGRPSALAAEGSAEDGASQHERLETWFDAIGLTVREREIGRSWPMGARSPG